ncbi:MAG: LysM peptidoglycan-binding domain-containing protein [Caldilinea sp.]|nr:LysM peptidoglycan-binding domain-containing protein [Caldilinea sp.]
MAQQDLGQRQGTVSEDLRSAATRPCPSCNSAVSLGAALCPACGESLPARDKQIRCRRCNNRALAALRVCPHCGRTLQPAPPRLVTWGGPLLLVVLFGVFYQWREADLSGWTQRQLERVATVAGTLGAQFSPDFSVTTRSVDTDEIEWVSLQPAASETAVFYSALAQQGSAQPSPAAEGPAAAPEPPLSMPAEDTPTATAPLPATLPAAEPTATATAAATTAATAAATLPAAASTATAIPLATPTQPPAPEPEEVAVSVTPTRTLLVASTAATGRQDTDVLFLPTPTALPPLVPPTATPQRYRIRAGDTLFDLALDNEITVEALLAANGLNLNDSYTLQPGDTLIIPDPAADLPTATAVPATATAVPATATAVPATATAGPATATPAIRLDPPTLRAPENNVSVKCGSGESLVWNPVPFVQPDELYRVHLGYVNGRTQEGAEQIVWVIAQQRPAGVTLWKLDDSLCGLAPFEFGRQWRWYVEVVEVGADGGQTAISPASPVWGFTWQ